MTEETILIKKKLKEEWANLKNESNPPIARRKSATNIIELQHKIEDIDPKFDCIDLSMTIFAEFLPATYKKNTKVKWGTIDKFRGLEGKTLEQLQRLEAIAVQEIHKKLPTEDTDSQKFGMIVSAYTEKLVALYIHFDN